MTSVSASHTGTGTGGGGGGGSGGKEKKTIVVQPNAKHAAASAALKVVEDEMDLTNKSGTGSQRGGGSGGSTGPAQLDLADDKTQMHVFSLQFLNNPDLEAEFCRDYHRKYAEAVRNSLLFSFVLWALFVILDISKNSDHQRRDYTATLVVRFVTDGIAIILWLLAYGKTRAEKIDNRRRAAEQARVTSLESGTELAPDSMHAAVLAAGIDDYAAVFSDLKDDVFSIFFRDNWSTLVALLNLCYGASQVIFGVIELNTLDPTYSVAVILQCSASSTFFRLRFVHSMFANWTAFALFVLLTGYYGSYDTAGNFILSIVLVLVGNVLFCVQAYSREYFIRKGFIAARKLLHEEQRSQNVLERMLPLNIIAQLRAGKDFVYKEYNSVSVLFCHICEFDSHTSALKAHEVVELLNNVFSLFDGVTDKYSVYKVETIGDVYLISSGCPIEREDHASVLCRAALAMQESMATFQHRREVKIRIGIHTGRVIAGVVGTKYPRYRLMGDTVNTSSRMSTSCADGDVQLSTSTYIQLGKEKKPHGLNIHYRGEILVKGKGNMKTYLLLAGPPTDAPPILRQVSSRGEATHGGVEVPPGTVVPLSPHGGAPPASDVPIDIKIRDLAERLKQGITNENDVKTDSTTASASAAITSGTATSADSAVATNTTTATTGATATTTAAGRQSGSLAISVAPIAGAGVVSTIRPDAALFASPSAGTASTITTGTGHHHANGDRSSLSSPIGGAAPHPTGAVVANNTNATTKLFEIPDVEAVVNPRSRPWWTPVLTFTDHPQLEADFQADYFSRSLSPNRSWIGKITLMFLLLAIFDTLNYWNSASSDTMTIAYIYRAVGVFIGGACYAFTYSRHYEKWMQVASAASLFCMTVLLILIGTSYGFYLQAYGVTCVLLVLGLVSMFMGFTFVSAMVTTGAILIFFLIVTLARKEYPGILLFLLAGLIIYVRTTFSSDQYVRLDYVRLLKRKNEERRTRHFLANMLPSVVVDELKKEARFIAHQFRLASVSFCDVVSFTTLASRITPIDVVAILNVLFATMDALTTKHRIYKVETIGDCYMSCSGVVSNQKDHIHDMVDCMLAFQTSTKDLLASDKTPIRLRIGTHAGFLIAGVVGRKMPRYHLFGETVTIAEEMEQRGIPGGVCVSEPTYLALNDQFECQPLEPVAVSGHSKQMNRYRVWRRKAALYHQHPLPHGVTTTAHPAVAAAAAAATHTPVMSPSQSSARSVAPLPLAAPASSSVLPQAAVADVKMEMTTLPGGSSNASTSSAVVASNLITAPSPANGSLNAKRASGRMVQVAIVESETLPGQIDK